MNLSYRLSKYVLLRAHVAGFVILDRGLLPVETRWEERFISTHRDLNAAYRAKHRLEAREDRRANDYLIADRMG